MENTANDKQQTLQGGLELLCRPVKDSAIGTVEGYVSTLKMTDPKRGVLMPNEYAPVANRSALCCELALWAVSAAAADIAALAAKDIFCRFVAVYTPVRLLQKNTVVKELLAAVKKQGVTPDKLCLQIPAEALFLPELLPTVSELRAEGFRVMLADFGTRDFPVLALHSFNADYFLADETFNTFALSDDEGARKTIELLSLLTAPATIILQNVKNADTLRAADNGFKYLLNGTRYKKLSSIKK